MSIPVSNLIVNCSRYTFETGIRSRIKILNPDSNPIIYFNIYVDPISFATAEASNSKLWLLTPYQNGYPKLSLKIDNDDMNIFPIQYGLVGEKFSNPIIYKRVIGKYEDDTDIPQITLPLFGAPLTQETLAILNSEDTGDYITFEIIINEINEIGDLPDLPTQDMINNRLNNIRFVIELATYGNPLNGQLSDLVENLPLYTINGVRF